LNVYISNIERGCYNGQDFTSTEYYGVTSTEIFCNNEDGFLCNNHDPTEHGDFRIQEEQLLSCLICDTGYWNKDAEDTCFTGTNVQPSECAGETLFL
jgi:hypothetical protein